MSMRCFASKSLYILLTCWDTLEIQRSIAVQGLQEWSEPGLQVITSGVRVF